MMMPTIPSTSSYAGSIVSSSSVLTLVDKATSEFLLTPDWTINIDICDTVNSNHWLAKDVVKAVKKRLQHKNSKVQLLALTLLETMVKNCGEYMHFQIADRNILQEMVKIVKKKADMHVRDKILVLLDSWQEAFGGPGAKYPQYYWAYEELRRSGVSFPERSFDTAPIFTPPPTHTTPKSPQISYGMPSNSSARLDEAMAAEDQTLSLSMVQSMRNVLDLLADMLQALNPKDRSAVKDEIIVDLVEQCRSNQKKLIQMLSTTGDEELMGQGLDLNDSLQNVLTKHDSIASGAPLAIEDTYTVGQTSVQNDFNGKPTTTTTTTSDMSNLGPDLPVSGNGNTHDGEEEEDDFLQLARRHSTTQPLVNCDSKTVTREGESSSINTSNAIVPIDFPPPATTNKEQDIIDLLSITLSDSISSENKSETHVPSSHNPYQNTQGSNNTYNNTHMNPPPSYSYVAPWAKPTPQPTLVESQPPRNPTHGQPQYYYGQSHPNPQFSGYYPPPPWAATPGYFTNTNPATPIPRNISHVDGQKPFIPSYKLFEELNVLGGSDGDLNATSSNASSSSSSSTLSGSNSHGGMIRGAK